MPNSLSALHWSLFHLGGRWFTSTLRLMEQRRGVIHGQGPLRCGGLGHCGSDAT